MWHISWSWKDSVEGMTMFHIDRKIDRIRKEVREWNKFSFGNLSKPKKVNKKKLEYLQNKITQSNAQIEQ